MRAGGMRNVITILRKVRMGKATSGEDIVTWATWRADILCEVEVRRGREHFDAGTKKRYAEDVYRFRTRYGEVEGLDATMVIVDEDGAKYDIKALQPDRQRESDAIIEATLQNATIGKKALILELLKATPAGKVSQVYPGFEVTADGGQTPYTFSVASGALPTGLTINGSSGQITGTPTVAGTSSPIVFRVTDAAGTTADLPGVTIIVAP